MKTHTKLILIVIAIKATLLAIHATELPESNHHEHIETITNEVTK